MKSKRVSSFCGTVALGAFFTPWIVSTFVFTEEVLNEHKVLKGVCLFGGPALTIGVWGPMGFISLVTDPNFRTHKHR